MSPCNFLFLFFLRKKSFFFLFLAVVSGSVYLCSLQRDRHGRKNDKNDYIDTCRVCAVVLLKLIIIGAGPSYSGCVFLMTELKCKNIHIKSTNSFLVVKLIEYQLFPTHNPPLVISPGSMVTV